MKKFINTALCLAVIAGAIPMGASAKSEPIYIEDGENHWEYTSIRGDINADGKISVADVVLLQKWIMGTYDGVDDEANKDAVDVNFDGFVDSFDLVQMRQLVINPEKAEVHTYAVDVLNTDAEIPTYEEITTTWEETENFNNIITEYDEMSAYLKTFITDNDELQKYLDKYDETFFEENNLILTPFIQERGNGVLMVAGSPMRVDNDYMMHQMIDKGIFFFIGGIYNEDVGLYPVTNTKMLAQITIPKSQTSAEDKIIYLDLQGKSLLSIQCETVSYTDGTHEIVITQENGWGINSDIYIKNDDGSFTYITGIYPDFYFTDGELSTKNYTITFLDDSFIVDYKTSHNEWNKIQSSYDGEDVLEFSSNEPIYKSPDGKTELYFNYKYYSSNNGGAILDETLIDIYLKETDGHLKHIGNLITSGYNPPFEEAGEWSVDSDGNNVFSNGDTYSITWLEDSIMVDYQFDDNQWAKGEIKFDSSGYADILYY
ncbi:MAG: dockerin type I repeat-containing protein [Alistipes senegalensis]|nr:dockerin type I repeat-containing protein [Alistipes senegalensis]